MGWTAETDDHEGLIAADLSSYGRSVGRLLKYDVSKLKTHPLGMQAER